SRLSDRKLKPLPPDPFRHQDSAIAPELGGKPLRWLVGHDAPQPVCVMASPGRRFESPACSHAIRHPPFAEDYGMSARLGSLRLDVGRSDDFRPFGNFRPDLESTLIGRIGNRLEAKRCNALLDVSQLANLDDLLIEQSDDLLGRSCWDEDSLPVLTLDVCVANFCHGRHAR